MIVYLITNKINGKQYVGQTTNSVENRWREHNWSKNGCRALKNAINKYGKENFKIEEIYRTISLEELDEREKEFIIKFNTLAPNGYNLKTGGNRSKYSDETKKIMSDKKTHGNFIPWNKGLTKEIDLRVGQQGSAGTDHPNYGKPGYWKNKKMPKGTSEKISKSKKGKPFKKTEKYLIAIKKVSEKRQIKVLCHQNGTIYDSTTKAAKALGIHQSNVSRAMNGKIKSIRGYTFSKLL